MEEEAKTEAEEKKGLKAKGASLWGQIIAAAWIAGWNAAQFVASIRAGRPVDVTDIVYSGLAIAACFTPVFINLVLDKIKDIKLGAK